MTIHIDRRSTRPSCRDYLKKQVKISTCLMITWGVALCGGWAPPAWAQPLGQPSFYRPLTLTANDTGGGGGGKAEGNSQEVKLAEQLQNPIANLISVPIQNDWDFGIGPEDAMRYTANIQPVIPFPLSEDWNLITRTILPVIYAEEPVDGVGDKFGLGDTLQSFFLSPKKPVGGWIAGAGPAIQWPTSTEDALGNGKVGAGPTAVVLRQEHGWTYGMLVNHVWSFAGQGNTPNVNHTFLQPFLGYTTKKATSFRVNTESTYAWDQDQWTVPLNFGVRQLVKFGKQPVQFEIGYRYYAKRPHDGPDWGLRFTVTFLFPKK